METKLKWSQLFIEETTLSTDYAEGLSPTHLQLDAWARFHLTKQCHLSPLVGSGESQILLEVPTYSSFTVLALQRLKKF